MALNCIGHIRVNTLLTQKDIPTNDNFQFEQSLIEKGFCCIAGSDEVGRGPLAGPVVAASVVLPEQCDPSLFKDSKTLSHAQRQKLFNLLIHIQAKVGIGIVQKDVIEKINILQASLLAMKHSVLDLSKKYQMPDFLLVDGKFEIPLSLPQEALVKGESKSASIAAASIVAKITRDEIMTTLHSQYPEYNFKNNKGYPTKEHKKAVALYGPCPYHRVTFKGVKEFV